MCYIHFTYPVSLHRISNSSEFVILQLAAERDHSETDTAAEDSEEDSEEQAQSHQPDQSASDYEEQPEEPAKCVLQLLQQLISLPKARRELHLAKDQVPTQIIIIINGVSPCHLMHIQPHCSVQSLTLRNNQSSSRVRGIDCQSAIAHCPSNRLCHHYVC